MNSTFMRNGLGCSDAWPKKFKIVRGSNSVQIRHSDAVLLNTQTNYCFVQKKVWPARNLNRQEREILRAPERRAANIRGYFDDPSWALHLSSADQKNNRAAKASKCWEKGNANYTGMRRSNIAEEAASSSSVAKDRVRRNNKTGQAK
jgi:hypothetical protein